MFSNNETIRIMIIIIPFLSLSIAIIMIISKFIEFIKAIN